MTQTVAGGSQVTVEKKEEKKKPIWYFKIKWSQASGMELRPMIHCGIKTPLHKNTASPDPCEV